MKQNVYKLDLHVHILYIYIQYMNIFWTKNENVQYDMRKNKIRIKTAFFFTNTLTENITKNSIEIVECNGIRNIKK